MITTLIEATIETDVVTQYVVYKRLRDEWRSLGNKKMVRFFNRRMSEIRLTGFGIC